MTVHRINHAYNIKKMRVPKIGGEGFDVRNNTLVLVQNGTVGVATVDPNNGNITWQEVHLAFSCHRTLTESLGVYKNLPTPFEKQLDTVFPDYDKSSSICWATSGDRIMQFNWESDAVTKSVTSIGDMIPQLPDAFKQGLTAAMGGAEGGSKKTAWLFKGTQCVRITHDGTSFSVGKAANIGAKWKLNGQSVPELANGIDAAIRIPGKDTGYFFVGDKYVTCDIKQEKLTAGPQLIRKYWHGVPYAYPVPDAVLAPVRPNTTPFQWYVFLGAYAMLLTDDASFYSSGKPNPKKTPVLKKITEHFPKLSGTVFASGVDSAANIGGTSYLVKGGKIFKPFDENPKVEDLSTYYGGSSRFVYDYWTTRDAKDATVYDLQSGKRRAFTPSAPEKTARLWESKLGQARACLQTKDNVPCCYLLTEDRDVWLFNGNNNNEGSQAKGRFNWELDWPDNLSG